MTYYLFKSLIPYVKLERTRKWLMQKATSRSYFDRYEALHHPYSTEEIILTVK